MSVEQVKQIIRVVENAKSRRHGVDVDWLEIEIDPVDLDVGITVDGEIQYFETYQMGEAIIATYGDSIVDIDDLDASDIVKAVNYLLGQ